MNKLCVSTLAASSIILSGVVPAFADSYRDSRAPRIAPDLTAPYSVPFRRMEPKNVPDFAQVRDAQDAGDAQGSTGGASAGTVLRSDLQSATLPMQTRFKLVVEYPVDAKTSQPGDIFEAHVKDDLFLGRSLILPRGSLVRGRVAEITKPRLISRAAKIG